MLERSRFWAGQRSEALKSMSYDYDLSGRRQSIELVSGISKVSRSHWQGTTLNSGMQWLSADTSSFEVTMQEIKSDEESLDDIVRLTCQPKDSAHPIAVAFGNGVSGRWSGYFSHGANQIVLDIDHKRMLPVREQLGDTSVTYRDWKVVDEAHSVPGLVRIEKQGVVWEMNFDWMGDAAWLLTYAEIVVDKNHLVIARTLNVKVNDQVVVRELSEKMRQREKSNVEKSNVTGVVFSH